MDLNLAVTFQATGENIVGLAVDLDEHFLFWSDNGPNKKGIYRSDLDGLQATKIIDAGKQTIHKVVN